MQFWFYSRLVLLGTCAPGDCKVISGLKIWHRNAVAKPRTRNGTHLQEAMKPNSWFSKVYKGALKDDVPRCCIARTFYRWISNKSRVTLESCVDGVKFQTAQNGKCNTSRWGPDSLPKDMTDNHKIIRFLPVAVLEITPCWKENQCPSN